MINVGIIGGETDAAGELIRILLNHPDVFVRAVSSPDHVGQRIDRFHRGLTGDTDLSFVRSLPADGLNCVFLLGEPWQAREYLDTVADAPVVKEAADADDNDTLLHIIDLTGLCRDGRDSMIYGFPEHRRKALVRGALRASLPSPTALALELALFPLAKNHLLHGNIKATVETSGRCTAGSATVPTDWSHAADPQLSTRLDPVAPAEKRSDLEAATREAEKELRSIDGSFDGEISSVATFNPDFTRGIKVTVKVHCGVSIDEVRRLYQEAYHDHGFTFPVDYEPSVPDISNTNKCLISIENEASSGINAGFPGLKITAVMDNLVKGSAGNAVHCMNLLFGLSEKTGLQLKASPI